MAGITTYLSILSLNVNGLNYPIKRHVLANWIKKEDPTNLLFTRNLPYRPKQTLP
jgi:exonuclease III